MIIDSLHAILYITLKFALDVLTVQQAETVEKFALT